MSSGPPCKREVKDVKCLSTMLMFCWTVSLFFFSKKRTKNRITRRHFHFFKLHILKLKGIFYVLCFHIVGHVLSVYAGCCLFVTGYKTLNCKQNVALICHHLCLLLSVLVAIMFSVLSEFGLFSLSDLYVKNKFGI